MKNSTAAIMIGGIVVCTVGVGVTSLAMWSVVPMTVYMMSATVIGTQTMNVLRAKSGKLQPSHTHITNQTINGTKIVALKREA